jgi:hypothetical protein
MKCTAMQCMHTKAFNHSSRRGHVFAAIETATNSADSAAWILAVHNHN